MKNNTLPNDDFEDFDDLDGYSDLLNETGPEENYEEPENWTIITAMNRVLNQARRSELGEVLGDLQESNRLPYKGTRSLKDAGCHRSASRGVGRSYELA